MNFIVPLKQSLYFFRTNALPLAAILLPYYALSAWLRMDLMTQDPENLAPQQTFITLIATLGLYPVVKTLSIVFIASKANNRAISWDALFTIATKTWPVMLGASILYGLTLTMGLLMFYLPLVFFYVRFQFVFFNVIFRHQNPVDAMISSWQQTAKVQWDLLAGALIIYLTVFTPLSLYFIGEAANNQPQSLAIISIIGDFLTTLMVIFSYRIYSQLPSENKAS